MYVHVSNVYRSNQLFISQKHSKVQTLDTCSTLYSIKMKKKRKTIIPINYI